MRCEKRGSRGNRIVPMGGQLGTRRQTGERRVCRPRIIPGLPLGDAGEKETLEIALRRELP